MKTNILILFIIFFNSFGVNATHNRSGSIKYRHITGNTYEITVKTCTKTSSDADRNELEIKWGDGTMDTIPRIDSMGTIYDVQENIYIGQHDFTGPGTYVISVEDPNRNAGIININSSVNVEFCIQSELVISPFIGSPNNSLIIEDCPCPEFACRNQTYCYNVSAYDPDGDSLSYALAPCLGQDCLEMAIGPVYNYPDVAGGGELSIDSITGTLCWVNPGILGEYNVAIKISEFRNGVYIGYVLQDMQISVDDCTNKPPVIVDKADTCIFVGEEANIVFTAKDTTDNIDLYATGQILNQDNPPIFNPANANNSVSSSLIWTPNCSQAKPSEYTIIIHAEDNDPDVKLTDLLTYRIKVNLPPVTNVQASPLGGSMSLTWDIYNPSLGCNDLVYNIYRGLDSAFNSSDCCDQGLIEAMGYELVGMSDTVGFLDDGDLTVGIKYCYLVTIKLPNGVESCVSNQVCEQLKFEVPALTNVSVIETDNLVGKDSIYWSWPKGLDFTNFPGPYYYELYRNNDFIINANELVFTSQTNADITLVDTFYFDENINTLEQPYNYQVALYSNGSLVGKSSIASSIWLTSTPNDNQLQLNWTENVPWTNQYYRIYKEQPTSSGNFVLIDSTINQTYVDTGLVNLESYCYKVESIGAYVQSGIRTPLYNFSQEHCNEPFDFTPPCPPTAFIDGNCDLEETYISWTNPNNTCADDVVKYNLYFAAFEGDSLELLSELNSDLDTFYVHKDRGSIAGCYYITAIDSLPYSNESKPSNIVCIDNCDGYYLLPNIFTPNGNSINDLYHPLLPYKFVESIDLVIYNRYGDEVHRSTDPIIDWDGRYLGSDKQVSDGVYFYTCYVNVIKLAGIQTKLLKGTITILNSK
ncbi:MAG: gliding motility-associated C-terminal domain-containing protein [Crocinitomicaceae bacterium]